MNNLSGKRAVLYRRVSTSEQKDKGNSLSTQEAMLSEFCKTNCIEIINDFEEDYSAKDFGRPGFSNLLKYVADKRNKIELLLIYKWDRFSRNSRLGINMIHQLNGMGVEVNSSTQWINHDDPNQHIMYLIHMGLPEVDNRIRSSRTIEGTRSNLKDGRWVLSQPKGYVKGRDEGGKVLMKPDKEISGLITELFNDFALGIYSQSQIRKLPKFKPLNLSSSNISRILNQIVYSGRIRVNAYKNEPEQIVTALHEPLISVETYEKVQMELGNRKRIKHKPNKQNNILPLRGYLSCNCCGKNLTGSGSKSKTGKKYYYYHGNPKRGCKERFRADLAHSSVEDLLVDYSPNKDVCSLFELMLKDKFDTSDKSTKSMMKSIDINIKKFEDKKEVLLDKLLEVAITNDMFNSKNAELENKISQLIIDKNQLNDYEKDSLEFIRFGIHILKNLGEFFEKATVNTKQKLLSSIFNKKLVFDGEKYRTPILNRGLELITRSINALEVVKNKNERQSFDYLPLCTRSGNRTHTPCGTRV
jgi:site-specific DNA recombinase